MLSETCTFVLGPRGVTTRTGKAANSLSGFPSELQRRGSLGGPELVLSQNKRRRLHAPLTPTAALMSGTGGHIGSESSLVNTERKGRGGRDQMSGTEDLETTRTGGHRASARKVLAVGKRLEQEAGFSLLLSMFSKSSTPWRLIPVLLIKGLIRPDLGSNLPLALTGSMTLRKSFFESTLS